MRAPKDETPKIIVDDLDMEEYCDQLTIYDGNSIRDDVITSLTGTVNDLSSTVFQ